MGLAVGIVVRKVKAGEESLLVIPDSRREVRLSYCPGVWKERKG